VKRTSYEAPHYTVFYRFPPLLPSEVHMFSSAPSPQTPSIYVPSVSVRNQVSHPYKTRQIYGLFYIVK